MRSYYNMESRKKEEDCPEGCWIISMYDMSPGNYWYGKKWFFLPKKSGEQPQACPTNLMRFGAKFINQDGQADTISIECVEDYSIQ